VPDNENRGIFDLCFGDLRSVDPLLERTGQRVKDGRDGDRRGQRLEGKSAWR
jgi:hypothetical protein